MALVVITIRDSPDEEGEEKVDIQLESEPALPGDHRADERTTAQLYALIALQALTEA